MTRIYRVEGDWSKYAIDYCMRNAFINYCTENDTKPTTIFCSNNFGQLFQLSLCGIATKHNLKIVFIPRKNFEKPYFYYGQEGDVIDA